MDAQSVLYTPNPVGPMPATVARFDADRLALALAERPTGDGIVTDLTSGERFNIRTGVACGGGCRCAAEAKWVRS